MFKKLLAIVAVALVTGTVHAESLHPCTPSVELKDMRMVCSHEDTGYVIVIKTLASPNYCINTPDYSEYQTADVTEIDHQTMKETKYKVNAGDFDFQLSPTPMFYFNDGDLLLENCVAPQHGGFSIGN